MSRRFAAETGVSTDKSIAEIRATVRRYGANEFAHMEGEQQAAVTFTMRGRRILFRLTMPDRKSREFARTPGRGLPRTREQTEAAWEQACRSRWRALALAIKAKLEAVEVGIVTFEDEFLSATVMPGTNVTFAEGVRENMALAHAKGSHAPLLPYLRPDPGAGEGRE